MSKNLTLTAAHPSCRPRLTQI